MKHDVQYFAEKAEECLEAAVNPRKRELSMEIRWADRTAALAQAQVYATLATAAQDKA